MNYATHYERLIARAKSRVLSGYVERHHIVPTCIGGTDELSNLVALTPEEHYVAHQLLVKMHPGNAKLVFAAARMTGKKPGTTRRSNKLYGWLRRKLAYAMSVRIVTAETRQKKSIAMTGIKRGKYAPRQASSSLKGKPKSVEHRAALSAAKLGKKRGPHSELHRARQSAAIKKALAEKGRLTFFDDPEYRARQALITKQRWARWKSGELPRPQSLTRPT